MATMEIDLKIGVWSLRGDRILARCTFATFGWLSKQASPSRGRSLHRASETCPWSKAKSSQKVRGFAAKGVWQSDGTWCQRWLLDPESHLSSLSQMKGIRRVVFWDWKLS